MAILSMKADTSIHSRSRSKISTEKLCSENTPEKIHKGSTMNNFKCEHSRYDAWYTGWYYRVLSNGIEECAPLEHYCKVKPAKRGGWKLINSAQPKDSRGQRRHIFVKNYFTSEAKCLAACQKVTTSVCQVKHYRIDQKCVPFVGDLSTGGCQSISYAGAGVSCSTSTSKFNCNFNYVAAHHNLKDENRLLLKGQFGSFSPNVEIEKYELLCQGNNIKNHNLPVRMLITELANDSTTCVTTSLSKYTHAMISGVYNASTRSISLGDPSSYMRLAFNDAELSDEIEKIQNC